MRSSSLTSSSKSSAKGQLIARKDPGPKLPLLVEKPRAEQEAGARRSILARLLRKIIYIPLLMASIAAIGLVAIYFQPPGLRLLVETLGVEPGGGTDRPIAVSPETLTKELPGAPLPTTPNVVTGLGKLLPAGDVITVAPPFGSADARIASLHVQEGDTVAAGDLLATLDNRAQAQSLVENAKAALEAKRAILRQVRESIDASRREAQAALDSAQSALRTAQADYDRSKALLDQGYLTRAVFDRKQAALDAARRDVDRLDATLSRYGEGSGDQQADVLVAARNVESAKSELARAEQSLRDTRITAPVSGTVLAIHTRAGEKPGPNGVLDMADITHMKADVEVHQSRIALVRRGAPVKLEGDAVEGELTGTVSRIGLEVRPQSLTDPSPAASTDARVLIVTVALDETSSQKARNLTNLQVVARIEAAGR